jgi:putative SOS response-associated peptidase YedK
MCNRYAPATPDVVLAYLESTPPPVEYRPGLGPCQDGPFIRQRNGARETQVGVWDLIADTAKQRPRPGAFMTNNCRSETVATKVTFKGPWARGQRCIAPALSYDEPNWESGKNVWWQFRRASCAP